MEDLSASNRGGNNGHSRSVKFHCEQHPSCFVQYFSQFSKEFKCKECMLGQSTSHLLVVTEQDLILKASDLIATINGEERRLQKLKRDLTKIVNKDRLTSTLIQDIIFNAIQSLTATKSELKVNMIETMPFKFAADIKANEVRVRFENYNSNEGRQGRGDKQQDLNPKFVYKFDSQILKTSEL